MTLCVTRSMLDFAASLGADWARVLLRALEDTTLFDMGEVKVLTTPPARERVKDCRQERLL